MTNEKGTIQILNDCAILFSDVKGFSKLSDTKAHLFYMGAFDAIAKLCNKYENDKKFTYINTWGDGLVAVFADHVDAVKFAIALRNIFSMAKNGKRVPKKEMCFPKDQGDEATHLNIRIALHSAPVYPFHNKVTHRNDAYGAGVNTAARLEPVVAPGHIFCTEAFKVKYDEIVKRMALNVTTELKEYGKVVLAKKWAKMQAYCICSSPNDPSVEAIKSQFDRSKARGWKVLDQRQFNIDKTTLFANEGKFKISEIPDVIGRNIEHTIDIKYRSPDTDSKGVSRTFCYFEEQYRISTFFIITNKDFSKILLYRRDKKHPNPTSPGEQVSLVNNQENKIFDAFGFVDFTARDLMQKVPNSLGAVKISSDDIYDTIGFSVEHNEDSDSFVEFATMVGYIIRVKKLDNINIKDPNVVLIDVNKDITNLTAKASLAVKALVKLKK